MRVVRGKVINGRVVTRTSLPEGVHLTVFVHEPARVDLDRNDQAAMVASIAELRAGRYAAAHELRPLLRRK